MDKNKVIKGLQAKPLNPHMESLAQGMKMLNPIWDALTAQLHYYKDDLSADVVQNEEGSNSKWHIVIYLGTTDIMELAKTFDKKADALKYSAEYLNTLKKGDINEWKEKQA